MPYLDLSEDFRPYYEIHDYTDPWTKPETILFVNGFAENTKAWQAWIPHLSRKYRLLTYDLRGFGRTAPVPETFNFSTDLFVDDMVRIINHLAGGPAHVVCGKSGGISTVRLAATRPDLVKSVVLGCPALTSPGSNTWLSHMEQFGIRDWARKTMPARLGYDTEPRCIDWWVDMMGATSLSTAQAYLRWVVTTEAYKDLPHIKCPALVIMTTATAKTNAAAGQMSPEEVKKLLPQSEFLVLDRECYHATGAHPDVCAQTTLQFLQKLA